ncbi:hypothetical protein PHYPO_G00136010 [Pangasianodon hypophthalmus]|uniref:Serine hydroxymethyltransferase, cytosolic n=1 Tax=Pangasianodon hypophthalmus TaxID=310915 RepID=A0A5N5KKY5_PANHP|nr:hypothetical protein PHYPO_G00136010 [Pangasianodon hypophthalmus]
MKGYPQDRLHHAIKSIENVYYFDKSTRESHDRMMQEPLNTNDPEVFNIIQKEKRRQTYSLSLIASENFTSRAVSEVLSSCISNKFIQQSFRYSGDADSVDELEHLCQQRALKVYGLDPEKWGVNVRPYSGSFANFAVYTSVVEPDGRIMGTTSYSCNLDYSRLRNIADENGAYLLGDMAHISGLVAAGLVPSPFDYCDIVSTSTYKTLRGCRAGAIFYRKGVRSVDAKTGKETLYNLESLICEAVFPRLQGGRHNHSIAGLAVALKQAMTPEFKAYQVQMLANCRTLASSLIEKGYKIVTGGTDTHLFLLDLRPNGIDGVRAVKVLQDCAIGCNKSPCPGDSALHPFGLRLGTPALTSRGLVEEDFCQVAELLHRGIQLAVEIQMNMNPKSSFKEFKETLAQDKNYQNRVREIRDEVEAFAGKFPMPGMPEL